MKKTLLILGAMVLASSSMFGAACSASQTLASLVALGGTGCDVTMNGDVLTFSNFSSSGSFLNSTVNANLDASLVTGQAGFQFVDTTGAFAFSPGTVGYTTTIKALSCPSGTCVLSGVFEQASITPTGSTAQFVLTESTGSPANLNFGNQTDSLSGSFTIPGPLTKSISYNGAGTVTNLQSDVFTTTTPEPMTLSMMGLGLLGLGIMRRRQTGKK